MSTARIVLLSILVIVVVIVGIVVYQIYTRAFDYPSDSPTGEYFLVVESGATSSSIAEKLEADNVVYSADLFEIREALQPINGLQVGEYRLQVPAEPGNLIKQINTQAEVIRLANLEAGNREQISVTLREGLGIDDYGEILEDEGVIASAEEFKQFAQNPNNFSQQRYEFLPEPLDCEYGDVTTCALYYPEGYLYPDTYVFFADSATSEVYTKMLDNFNTKVWSRLGEQAAQNDQSFYQVITLASVLEKETGRTRGIQDDQLDEVNAERRNMSQVFYNRIDAGMMWQSDVTIEYGTGRKVCQQTFEVKNCFLLDDPITQHKYNTYLNKGYPIGPVTNPQFFNIEAALNPTRNNYLFFVSDVTGKKYFAETGAEHEQVIEKVNEINRELGS